jgi:uncharacterized protein (DUF952 family)
VSTTKDIGVIFKICGRGAWDEALRVGHYSGSCDDRRDGFIHLSTRAQLAGTAAKHFRGQSDLVLVVVDAARLGSALRWEPARGGELFPHLYAALDVASARAIHPLLLGRDGVPQIPEDLG